MARLLTSAARRAALGIALGSAAGAAAAAVQQLELSLDMRVIDSRGEPSFLNGGEGKLRFDPNHDGARMGQARVAYSVSGTHWRLDADASAWGDGDRQALDLTELYATYKRLPKSAWQQQVKLGAFYPAISLENRRAGWRSPYSLSSSAINTWIGEELRTIGAEYRLEWNGPQLGSPWSAALEASAYGYNDPAGIVIARRGWALHDRQTTLFGRVGTPGQGRVDGRIIFHSDIDGRAGWYAGGSVKYRGLGELRILEYDNRGDPAIEAPEIDDFAWLTQFKSLGVRLTPSESLTLIAQHLNGRTYVGPAQPTDCWTYKSQFALASWRHGSQFFTVRYDDFEMAKMVSSWGGHGSDRGHAFTVAWNNQLAERWQLSIEWLDIHSHIASPTSGFVRRSVAERQVQLGLSYDWHGYPGS